MKKIVLALTLAALSAPGFAQVQAPRFPTIEGQAVRVETVPRGVTPRFADLKAKLEHLTYALADDSMRGRAAGSPDGLKAAEYIAREFRKAGVAPLNGGSYFQKFSFTPRGRNVTGPVDDLNVIGIIPGNDPDLKDEYILIGAHYDHVGVRERDGVMQVYNGADDNATGTAALIEIARYVQSIQPKLDRSVVVAAFGAEEMGLVGSRYFVEDEPLVPIAKVKLMISIDMIGWYSAKGGVVYSGAGPADNAVGYVTGAGIVPDGLKVVIERAPEGESTRTDNQYFAVSGVPTFHVTTDVVSPYHQPEDDADLVDYDGMTLITEHLMNITTAAAGITEYDDVDEYVDYRDVKAKKNRDRFATFGVAANVGNSFHRYDAGAANGKPGFAFGVGLWSDLNIARSLALRPEVYYERLSALDQGGMIRSDVLTVPLSLVLKSPGSAPVGMDLSLGGYYSYALCAKQKDAELDFGSDYYRNAGGLTWGVGVRLDNIRLGFTARYALTDALRETQGAPNYGMHANYFTVSYRF